MRKKIVFIGAGSAMFTKGLLLDIIERTEHKREKWHIALVDRDRQALDIITIICRKIIAHKEADIELSYSTDRRDVLCSADYVICTIGVGGRRAWEQDVFIPRRYGVFQPVGDTIGPGGVSRAMRMIPAMIDIAKDVAKFCPNAMMFNYSNPMTAICMAVRRAACVPIVGLCHGVDHGWRRVSKFMGYKPEDVSITACGLNHMVYLYRMRYRGKDLFPDFIEKLNLSQKDGSIIGPLSAEFAKLHNAYVASDDRHYTEFVPEIMGEKKYYGKTLGIGNQAFTETFSFEATIDYGDEIFDEYSKIAKSNAPICEEFVRREEGDNEQLMGIIAAMLDDRREVFYANLPNNSAVFNVPAQTVLELPVLVTGSGIQALQLPDFPCSLLPGTLRYAGVFEAVVQAAINGDASLMCCAIEESSPRLERGQAQKLTDELLTAQKEYLP